MTSSTCGLRQATGRMTMARDVVPIAMHENIDG